MSMRLPDQPFSPAHPGTDEKTSPNIGAGAGTQTSPIPEASGEADSSYTEAEMLLKALRNVIIPLTHPADGEYNRDVNQNTLGPDGEQFVIALKKFMLSFLHQQGPEDGIKVELEEEGENTVNTWSWATSNDELSPQDVADPASDTESSLDSSVPNLPTTGQEGLWSILPFHNEESLDGIVGGSTWMSQTDRFERRKSQFFENILNALREHVFNTMPIRLLCFKLEASELQITLTERGEIYAHIASSLENNIDLLELSREIIHYKRSYGVPSREAERRMTRELIDDYSRYAILSHTWLRGASGEVTYGDWIRREFDAQQPGYQKLLQFCKTAWKDYGVTFGWIDTICINKESSSELDESIRSMYKWYNNADICITYLAETVVLSDMSNDSWFTRGWTLQELFAPSDIKFYNPYWNKLVESDENDKEDSVIQKQIEEATTITTWELQRHTPSIPISRRMEMAAKRQVTREEDSAYSLMGICDVSITTAYGEGGQRAFSRLLVEVLNSSSYGVTDIFNWAGLDNSRISSLLPYSLQGYLHRSSSLRDNYIKPVEPIMLTHLGLRVTIVLMPVILIQNLTESRYGSFGDYHAIADIPIHPHSGWHNVARRSYSILDARISNGDDWNEEKNWYLLKLGVLNVGDGGNEKIYLPRSCLAVALRSDYGSPRKVPTDTPIIFTLNKRGGSDMGDDSYYHIKRSELDHHGMKLVTIIL